MTLRSFQHIAASSLEEAAEILGKAKGKAVPMAGGTDLLGVMKDRIHAEGPQVVVDLKTIGRLSYIKADKKGLRIGALTPLDEIVTNEAVRAKYPLLAEAAHSVASPQIRNMGTIGGNICQEPRCWYYRAPDDLFHCIRKGGDKCGALLGENRYHSIFGSVRVAEPACTAACPAHTEIPAYMDRIRQGDLDAAARIVLDHNPIPAITGRICPHFCEIKCNRSEFDESVSIQNVERTLGDHILDNAALFMKPPKKERKKTVAVVGSGPAGLSAAYFLRKEGWQVTVFDKMPEPGGMLTYGIPAYRLPKEIVKRQVKAFEGMGIVFKMNYAVGQKGKTLKDLGKNFDKVFLAVGAWGKRTLNIDKAELLTSGLDFLMEIGLGKTPVLGKKVLVIGGGNVAVDVALSARRLGAKQVTMACLESREIMPAFPEEIEEALHEGVELVTSAGPHKIIEKGGKITGMDMVACTSVFDGQGRFNPSFDTAQKQTIKADQIILAIGQATDLSFADDKLKAERGWIVIDDKTAASLDDVYAGGDVVHGPSSVIKAVAAGRQTAHVIAKIKHESKLEFGQPLDMHPDSQCRSERTQNISGPEDIRREAQRCANCGCVAVNASDLAPALIALDAKIVTTQRTLNAGDFFQAGIKKTTVLEDDELVKEIEIPSGAESKRQGYLKFRIRNAIDFPIVSLAYVLGEEGGTVKNASIVLGAVAPLPLRAKGVEAFLKGKPADEATAIGAGNVAAEDIKPLSRNRFKVQIVRALIKKMLLNAS
jgi:NADPH-dependent glutamate synthase beta subunit-like oxidoreductase/CO/xanthine dehydrogenase FAD-binding subunit